MVRVQIISETIYAALWGKPLKSSFPAILDIGHSQNFPTSLWGALRLIFFL